MKLLVVTKSGRLDPSALKRVFGLLPYLRGMGHRVCVVSERWEILWRLRAHASAGSRLARRVLWTLNALRLTSLSLAIRDGHARRRLARLAASADAVIVSKTLLDPATRSLLAGTARAIAYDVDDAVWLYDPAAFAEMARLCGLVVAGNDFLAGHVRVQHPRVEVIPTVVDVRNYPQRRIARKTSADVVIGWIGSPSTVKYLELLVDPLIEVMAAHPVRLEVVGSGPSPIPNFGSVPVRLFPQVPYDPRPHLQRFDVGVAPMADGIWERGKCGAKILEYMAAGLPAVAAPVGENCRILTNGVTGFLAGSCSEWRSALIRLIEDPLLRSRMGHAARRDVEERYSAESGAMAWQRVLGAWLGQRPAAAPA